MRSKIHAAPVGALIAGLLCTHAALSFAGGDAPADVVEPSAPAAPTIFQTQSVETFFSPGDSCINAVVREILTAKKSVRVLSSALNSKDIAAALAIVRRKSVDVTVLVDTARSATVGLYTRGFLKTSGVKVLRGDRPPVDSNIIVIDDEIVLTGSSAFTHEATVAAGNLIVIRNNQRIVNAYIDYWNGRIKNALSDR